MSREESWNGRRFLYKSSRKCAPLQSCHHLLGAMTFQKYLAPAQVGLATYFTVSKKREIISNSAVLYRYFVNIW
jgi:hypothetical protein